MTCPKCKLCSLHLKDTVELDQRRVKEAEVETKRKLGTLPSEEQPGKKATEQSHETVKAPVKPPKRRKKKR